MGLLLIDDDTETGPIPVIGLTQGNGIHISKFDPGFPRIREVMHDRVNSDGEFDSTAFHGASRGSIQGLIRADQSYAGNPGSTTRRQAQLDKILAHFAPGARSYIQYAMHDDGVSAAVQRFIQFRADRVRWHYQDWATIRFAISFTNPRGVILGPENEQEWTVNETRTIPNTGNRITYPKFEATLGAAGSTNPRIETTTGSIKKLYFTGTPGGVVQVNIDMWARTAILTTGADWYQYIDWTVSEWFGIEPGGQGVKYSLGGGTSGGMQSFYRDAHL